jgi:hypothetical protein
MQRIIGSADVSIPIWSDCDELGRRGNKLFKNVSIPIWSDCDV